MKHQQQFSFNWHIMMNKTQGTFGAFLRVSLRKVLLSSLIHSASTSVVAQTPSGSFRGVSRNSYQSDGPASRRTGGGLTDAWWIRAAIT